MTRSARPNYFDLLELNPDEPWNQARYLEQLRNKRGQWSRLSNTGVQTSPRTIQAKQALALLGDLEQVMGHEVSREKERADAKLLRAVAANAARDELVRTLDIVLEKGFLFHEEEAALRREYGALLDDERPARLLNKAQRRAQEQEPGLPDRLEPATAAAIRGSLDELGEKSLYTLLAKVDPGLGPDSDGARLVRAAEELYRWTISVADKTQEGLTAKQMLAGHAKTVFGAPEKRKQYDNTLASEPVDRLLRRYRSALATTQRVEGRQAERFLREATDAGVAESVARALLLDYFSSLKWVVVLPPPTDTSDLKTRCPGCHAFNELDAEFCHDCGAVFRVVCPKCSQTVAALGLCSGCGFPVGDRDWVRHLLDECEDLLRSRNLAGASEKLREARQVWKLPEGSQDELAVRITECNRQLAEEQAQRVGLYDKTLKRIRDQMAQRHYSAAFRLLESADADLPDRERRREEVRGHIDAADRLCQRAEQTEDPEQRVELWRQALAECADHEQARRALRNVPPPPARELRVVTAKPGLVRLVWLASPMSDVRYTIVRKANEPPVSISDGKRIGTVSTLSYDDRSPEIGIPMYYGVFAVKQGTPAQQAASTPEPVLLTQDITVTSVRVDDGTIELAWRLPPHAEAAEVRRGGPESGDGGDAVPAEPTRLLVQGLPNGVRQTFTVRARFRDSAGNAVLSQGKSVSLTPGPPPGPVGTLHVVTLQQLGFGYRSLQMTPAAEDEQEIVVLTTTQRPAIQAGDRLPETELSSYGTLLTVEETRRYQLPFEGLYYFVPVLARHGIGYVGEARRYAAVAEVEELSATMQGDSIRLRWTWPQDCETVLVAYQHAGAPADPTVAEHQEEVSRADYEKLGCHEIPFDRRLDECLLVVAALSRRDEDVFVSTGVRCHVRGDRQGRWGRKRR